MLAYNNRYTGKGISNMNIMSYSSLRIHLADTLNKVNEDHAPVIITRQNGQPAVVMSLEVFRSYEETAYLMARPKNAERLNQVSLLKKEKEI